MQSITEGDIIETKPRIEYQGNKPSNRYDISVLASYILHLLNWFLIWLMHMGDLDDSCRYERLRKSDSSPNSASSSSPEMIHEGYQRRFTTDSSCEVIHKGAGIGWGGGRGKVNDTSNTSKHIGSIERVILPSSSFAKQESSVGKCHSNLVSSSCNQNEQLRPHGGAQSRNAQQQSIQFGSPPTHQGRGHHGSTVSPTYSWKHSSATSSVQGSGRSQHVQDSSVEESGSH
jgi:hypothetical protein